MRNGNGTAVIWKDIAPVDYERAAFVAKAMTRSACGFTAVVHAEGARGGTRLVATDGKRLHVAVVRRKIPSGDYKPTVTAKEVAFGNIVAGIKYPAWRNVVPENARLKCEIDLADAAVGKESRKSERLSVACKRLMQKTGEAVNIKFLDELPKRKWNVYAEKKKPILLKESGSEESAYAVIAPIAA